MSLATPTPTQPGAASPARPTQPPATATPAQPGTGFAGQVEQALAQSGAPAPAPDAPNAPAPDPATSRAPPTAAPNRPPAWRTHCRLMHRAKAHGATSPGREGTPPPPPAAAPSPVPAPAAQIATGIAESVQVTIASPAQPGAPQILTI